MKNDLFNKLVEKITETANDLAQELELVDNIIHDLQNKHNFNKVVLEDLRKWLGQLEIPAETSIEDTQPKMRII